MLIRLTLFKHAPNSWAHDRLGRQDRIDHLAPPDNLPSLMSKAGYPSCEKCGAPLWNDAPVPICGQCLLMEAIAETQLRRQTQTGGKAMNAEDETVAMPTPRSKNPAGFELPEPEELQELFPRLEQFELLGAGGMGAVYKARQPEIDRFVAVKILSKKLAADPEFVARFKREAKAMAKLDHPNIVTIYDFGERGGFYFFIMEFIDGGDLQQLLAGGKLDPAAALELVPQICEAIQFAHEEGVTHRDLKPANLLLDTKGRVKVADFGLAKILAGTSDISLTMPGTAMGTPFYMAPEQFTDAEHVDERADIYSLGVVLYQMLTGVLPQGDFDPPSKTLPDLGSSVDNAVMRALAQDPNLRYSEVKEMREALERVREERRKRKPKKPKSKRDPNKESGKRGSPVPWGVGAALAALIAVAIGFWKPWEARTHSGSGAEPPVPIAGTVAPLVPTSRHGFLRGILNADDGSSQPMNLGELSDVGDLVQVRTTASPDKLQIIGLRTNGKVIGANLPEGWQKQIDAINSGPSLRHLGYNHLSIYHLVGIDRNGRPVPLFPDHLDHQNFPSPGEPLADVRTAEGHCLMLTVSGRAYAWGSDFEKSDNPWPMPPEELLDGIAEIRVGTEVLFFRGFAGEVWAWGPEGLVDLPEQMQREMIAIGILDTSLQALDRDGNLWLTATWSEFDRLARDNAPIAAGVTQLKDQRIGPTVIRAEEGLWVLTDYWRDYPGAKAIEEQLAEIGGIPPDAFMTGGGKKDPNRFLVWIEPAAAGKPGVAGSEVGEERIFEIAPGVEVPMIWCPPGEFQMGSPEDEPGREADETQHRVSLTEGYWLAKTEFTIGDWVAITSEDWRREYREESGSDPKTPVNVSWVSVSRFLESIQPNSPEGWRFDLPTEAQWEYACRAGTSSMFFFGQTGPDKTDLERLANTADRNSSQAWAMNHLDDGFGDVPAPVASFDPNPWGFHDLVGNVSELCRDWYGPYPTGHLFDPAGPRTGSEKVTRGGSYHNGWADLRSSARHQIPVDLTQPTAGFRLALVRGESAAAVAQNPAEATKDRPFVNSLGMKFVPVPGTDVLFCIHETRYLDYAAFAASGNAPGEGWKNQIHRDAPPDFQLPEDTDALPVININWQEAKLFCEWLSREEGVRYRLPTDREWSLAVGIGDREDWEEGSTPQEIYLQRVDGFPWGDEWPPPSRAGNYSDESLRRIFPNSGADYVEGYDDGYAATAPVMSFAPNRFGIYDLGGNVWEYVEDWYNEDQKERTQRGSAWHLGIASMARSSKRHPVNPELRQSYNGYRIVIELEDSKGRAESVVTGTNLPEELAAMKERGGKLRVWSQGALPGELDLSPADGIDDLIELDGDFSPPTPANNHQEFRWMARRASGTSITSMTDFERRAELAGLDTHYAVLSNGELMMCWGNARNRLPGSYLDAAHCSSGPGRLQFGLFLRRDGTVSMSLDRNPATETESPGLAEVRTRLESLTDVVKIDAGNSTAAVLRANGEVIAWNLDGFVSPVSPVQNAVDVACGADFWVALEQDGTVKVWTAKTEWRQIQPPDDLGPAFRVVVGGIVCAAQMADGSWRAWGPQSLLVDRINTLGKAVDLKWHHVAEVLLWIEPAAAEPVAPKIDLPPAIAAMKERGGSLRSWSSVGSDPRFDISRADGIDDFIYLDGRLAVSDAEQNYRWLARRASGESVASLENFEFEKELVEIDTHVGLLESGSRVEIHAQTTEVVQIDANYEAAAALLSDGTVVSWYGGGLVEPPAAMTDVVSVACGTAIWLALDAQGKVWTWVAEKNVYLVDRIVPPSDIERAYAIRAGSMVCAAQMKDGTWRAWGHDFSRGVIDQIHRIGPAVDVQFNCDTKAHSGRNGRVLWIEPAAADE